MLNVNCYSSKLTFAVVPFPEKPSKDDFEEELEKNVDKSLEFESFEAAKEVASFLTKTGYSNYCYVTLLVWAQEDESSPMMTVVEEIPVAEVEIIDKEEDS